MAAIDQERGEKATAHCSASMQRRVEGRVLAVECFHRLQKLSSLEKQEKDNSLRRKEFWLTAVKIPLKISPHDLSAEHNERNMQKGYKKNNYGCKPWMKNIEDKYIRTINLCVGLRLMFGKVLDCPLSFSLMPKFG